MIIAKFELLLYPVHEWMYCMQLFRSDLISAMKLPDSMHLDSGSFLTIKEQWRTEWEVGVQVSEADGSGFRADSVCMLGLN